jgi:hypothetical protein
MKVSIALSTKYRFKLEKTPMTNLFAILFDYLILLIFSICLNFSLLVGIRLGILGSYSQVTLNGLLAKRIHLIPIFSFFFFILIIYHSNTMYLDHDEVIVSTTIGDMNFQISGEAITQICRNFGSATVFAAGARIAAGLVAKHPMGLIPKVGTIGGTGAGFTVTYRMILDSFNQGMIQSHGHVSVSAPIKITLGKIEHLDRNHSIEDLIPNAFNPERFILGDYSAGLRFRKYTIFNDLTNKYQTILSDANVIENSRVLRTLEQFNPN